MAKMACISGSVVGKIGGNVYSINSGQQIVRAYQPNVANPSTELQVSTRSKFKLASQLAAAVSPVLAISKVGMVSGRNQFMSAAMAAITEEQGEATVDVASLQLTKSGIDLPGITATRGEQNHVAVSVSRSPLALGVTKVVYALFTRSSGNKLELINTLVVSEAGQDGHFAGEFFPTTSRDMLCYAYGIIEGENSVLAKYDSYQVEGAQFIATLISSRSSAASGLKTTTTQYALIAQGA